ncbi:MAG: formylglycine-generating enzyme family protein [Planctomycetes bacterium]|nr:formylglycine-generating enzyme family protein [Planctomycetota bacterium]
MRFILSPHTSSQRPRKRPVTSSAVCLGLVIGAGGPLRAGETIAPPQGLEAVFDANPDPRDALGNPVRAGIHEATGWPLEIRHKPTGICFVFIPPGEFQMGSPDAETDRDGDEGPVHRVRLTRPFYLGKYEVTRGQWKRITGSDPAARWSESLPDLSVPSGGISWSACQNFIASLNRGLGEGKGFEFALPTEAQWEYACRAGSTTRFSFGADPDYSELDRFGWCSSDPDRLEERAAHPVGRKLPNPWGLYDMHGNILEWCRNWHGPYAGGQVSDPEGPATGKYRALRGGSWYDGPEVCRSANRGHAEPFENWRHFGLRLALNVGAAIGPQKGTD